MSGNTTENELQTSGTTIYEQKNDKGEIERITYLSEIKSKAEDLRDSEIANSQMGYINKNIEE